MRSLDVDFVKWESFIRDATHVAVTEWLLHSAAQYGFLAVGLASVQHM